MSFSQVDRVIYKKNPLEQVLCQLRYSPILAIDSKLPAEFQDYIRDDFPIYEEMPNAHHEITAGINFQLSDLTISPFANVSTTKNHIFITEDRDWRIDLTRDNITLTSKKYERWEDFRERLKKPLDALCEVYRPSNFIRLGLRYINLFKRTALELDNVDWKDLICEPFAGILSSDFSDMVRGYDSIFELDLKDGTGKVRISAALVTDISNEICFLLDNDFYVDQKIAINNADDYLDKLNYNSTIFLHHATKEKLRNAMEPIMP